MLPRKMLMATDGSEYASSALDTALSLASRFSSSLGLLHVVNVRQLEGPFISDLSGMVGVVPFLNFQQQVREVLYRKGENILAAALALCARKGVEATTILEEGVVSRVICREAKSYDLVCLGRHGEHEAFRGLMMGATVEEAVRGCTRPILVAGGEQRDIRRILVPYDGSQTASSALALAVEMAGDLGASLTVLRVGADPREGQIILDEARRYIEPRSLAADFMSRPGDPAAVITGIAEEGFDLVIMGAYGHSRLRELFLGSTTAGVLHRIKLPVLLYR